MSPRTQNRSSEDPGLSAWLTLVQANSLLLDLLEADLMASQGMPLGWFEVLVQLTSAPDSRLKMQELAHSVLLSKSGVTRLVDRMEAAGLVTRAACPTDRRAVYAVVTPQGREALRAALPPHLDSLTERFTNHLTPGELNMLRTTLQKVLDAHGFVPTCPSVEQLASADEPRETPVG
jgi:DNA-binding MarR family transcriptional regulator